jgi:hypothetical protein
MTVQEKLIERVQRMTDEEAAAWLRHMEEHHPQNGQEREANPDGPPLTLSEMIGELTRDIPPRSMGEFPRRFSRAGGSLRVRTA